MLQEVSKMAPGALTKFEYKSNKVVRIGGNIFAIFLLSIIIVPLIWHFHWSLFIILGAAIIVTTVGNRFNLKEKTLVIMRLFVT